MICKKCNHSIGEALMSKWGDICTQCTIWFAQEQMNKHKDELERFLTKEQ